MPMEVLSLEVEGEYICEQSIQGSRDIFDRLRFNVRRSLQRGLLQSDKFIFPRHSLFLSWIVPGLEFTETHFVWFRDLYECFVSDA